MIKENPEDSVREEQDGTVDPGAGTEDAARAEKAEENNEDEQAEAVQKDEDETEAEVKAEEEVNEEVIKEEVEASEEAEEEAEVKAETEVEVEAEEETEAEVKAKEETETEDEVEVEVKEEEASGREGESAETAGGEEPHHDEGHALIPELHDLEEIELPPVDYSGYSKHDLVETLNLIIDNRPPAEIRDDVERIKVLFYKKLKQEAEEKKAKFLEGGGKIEEYKVWVDPLDFRVKELLEKYREKKNDYSKIQEAEKYENLKRKYDIIDRIKDLVNREESINKTFHDFRSLQNDWHSVGVVPQSSLKDLWENYHHSVEVFYDYIKINKELRDLDLRKNLEAKVVLCEKAEELLLEPNPVNAFRILQDLHNQWREIGPVPQESKNEIWDRFREATSQINKRHHEYFEKQKDDQRKNLEAKMLQLKNELCIQAEALQESTDWKATSDALIKLQKEWKEVGPVPRKQSEKTWKRFRKACDHFFNRKAEYFANLDTSYEDNLKAKMDIIGELEKFEPGSDVQAAFERLKDLQRKWTEIGFVPFNKKEEITNRYRNALNKEFDKLKIADEDKSILKYRNKLDNLRTNPKASRKVRNERDKFFTKIKQLENDIVLWENNIGFFAKSPNADTMIKEVQEKIENAKKMIKTLEEKVKMIDQSGLDD